MKFFSMAAQYGGPTGNEALWPLHYRLNKYFEALGNPDPAGLPIEYSVVLRVSGSLVDYGGEGPERMKVKVKARDLTMDLVIPKVRWQGKSTLEILPYFCTQMRACFSILTAEAGRRSLITDQAVHMNIFDTALKNLCEGDLSPPPKPVRIPPRPPSAKIVSLETPKPEGAALSRGKQGGQKFFNACSTGKVDVVRDYIAAGIDTESRDTYNLTGLIWTGRKGHVKVAEVLLDCGAKIDAEDSCHRTALFHAVVFKRYDFVEFLAGCGGDLNPVDMHGTTPLDTAMRKQDTRMVDLLKSLGAKRAKEI
jgi:Ankyrin repeats (3 copies)